VSVLYATVAELKKVLSSTDAGSGTAATLNDDQLTLALQAGSNRVSVYSGTVWDSSTPASVPPDILHDLTLDLAAFWANKTYLKHKEITPTSGIWLAYTEAMKVLEAVRKGEIRLDPQAPGSVGQETGRVINRIPNVFQHDDSNTRVNSQGNLEASTPPDMWVRDAFDDWGTQGW
jgi:phage gp36-like protein